LVFAFTVSIAKSFNLSKGKMEDAMWSRLMGKQLLIPVVKVWLGIPAACCTALTAVPAYTDPLVLCLAIGETQRLWSKTRSMQSLWTNSWAQVPVLRHIVPWFSLPSVLTMLMMLDQIAHLLSFTMDLKGESYAELASAASISSFLFLNDLFNCQVVRPGGIISEGKMLAARHRFFNKVVLGTGLRLWFKVSLLVLLKEADVLTGLLTDPTERTLVLAILTSFAHAASATSPIMGMMFGRRTPGSSPETFNYGPLVIPGGCLGLLVILFPVWGSVARFLGAYLCKSHNFAFSGRGCVAVANATNFSH
jgi:hypothetical protein